jgi:DNA adenine methylase
VTSLLAESRSLRPFIKWAGGKTRLLPLLLRHVPDSFRRYHEPFLGGGAMLLAVHDRGELAARVSDLNDELVNAWQTALADPARLYERLLSFGERDSERYYYEVRGKRFSDDLDRAAHFLYLNRTSWNGLYRVNRWGEFNVPWGARKFAPPPLETLERLGEELAGVRFKVTDFRRALAGVEEGDFVYLDPPYLRVSDTSKFNGYTQKRFVRSDLIELAERLHELTEQGVGWLLSNRDSSEIRGLFPEEEIVRLTVRRSVAAQNRRDIEPSRSPEVIISNRLLLL